MSKKSQKGAIKKLKQSLKEYVHDPNSKNSKEILPTINTINDLLNKSGVKGELSADKLTEQLYQDNTIALLIQLMPFFDQQILNAISTLLQTTTRKFPDISFPRFLMNNQQSMTTFISFFNQQNAVFNTSHILLRSCLRSRDFTKFLFNSGFVGSFIQYLSGGKEDFDKITTSFGTYDAILNTQPDISAEFIRGRWQIFLIQFKQLLNGPNYLVQMTFLPILLKFLMVEEAHACFMKYLEDVENLQLLMFLLVPKKNEKKVQIHAYALFKLFVINPRKAPQIVSALKRNKSKLVKILADIKLEDGDPALEEEKQKVINLINKC